MEEKKEDDEGIPFYFLLASGMHRSGRNLAGKNAAAVVCSRETMVAAICFIGELLEPALGIHRDILDWGPAWQGGVRCRVGVVGSATQREDDGDGKKERMGNDGGMRILTHKRTQFANC